MASGTQDGSIVIFDVDTDGVLTVLRGGHSRPIQSISWSSSSRYLLSGSQDWKCIIWDLAASPEPSKRVFNFETPVWNAEFHPLDETMFAVALLESEARIIELTSNSDSEVSIKPEGGSIQTALGEVGLSCAFDPTGKSLVLGTSKGTLHVFDTITKTSRTSFKVCSSNIKNILLSSRYLVTNSSDRVIRLFSNTDGYELLHKFQDVVNRLQWNSIALSMTQDFLIASTYHATHSIYMWDTHSASLIKIYTGPKEELISVDWHPVRPAIASSGLDSGAVYTWKNRPPQRWSALAPDFVEVEENVIYEEREDEFDLEDDKTAAELENENEEIVDIMTKPNPGGLEKSDLFYIKVDLDQQYDTNVEEYESD